MICSHLKYVFVLLTIIVNECASKTAKQDDPQLKFVFIVSTKYNK